MPEFHEFAYWGFQGIISVAALWIAKSVNDLNIKIAVVIANQGAQEKRIEKLEYKSHDY